MATAIFFQLNFEERLFFVDHYKVCIVTVSENYAVLTHSLVF
jgi:hypothetical protein